jgi:hypothetical protein
LSLLLIAPPLSHRLLDGLHGNFDAIHLRATKGSWETYYESVLAWVTQSLESFPDAKLVIIEQGSPTGQDSQVQVSLLTDILGLMLQPVCRTEDSGGGIRFTDVSNLFDRRMIEHAQAALAEAGLVTDRAMGAAVAATGLLTAAERKVLNEMGAGVGLTYSYLDARAARARGLPALGAVTLAHGEDVLEQVLVALAQALRARM